MQILIAQEKGKPAEIKLYGTIADWTDINASRIDALLSDLEKKGVKEVTLAVHSPGGSVFEGIAIQNLLKRSKLSITVRIDGISASMMSAIMLGAKRIIAYPNSRVMVHQASGGVQGSAAEMRRKADLLESANNQLAEDYAQKTGKSAKWVQDNWLVEGVDKWFTAKEALQAGLIDEILPETTQTVALTAMLIEKDKILNIHIPQTSTQTHTQTRTNMNERIIAMLAQINRADNISASADTDALITMLEQGFADLIEKAKQLEKSEEVAKTDKVATEINKKGLPPKQMEALFVMAKSTEHNTMLAYLGSLPDAKPISVMITANAVTANALKQEAQNRSGERNGWTYQKYEKEAPKELLAMMSDDPERYNELLEAHFDSAFN